MLKIRLKVAGRKKKVFYKIVVTENSAGRDGKILSELGYYNPIEKCLMINKTTLLKYLKDGAYPTLIVRYLIKKVINSNEINF